MKKLILFIIFLTGMNHNFTTAQNSLGKSDDMGRISITAFVEENMNGMPAGAREFLTNKLQQIVTLNGLGGGSINPRFVITANVATLTKDVIPGPPAMIAQNLQITFYIVDYQERIVFNTTSMMIKGVGTNDTKAYIQAIKTIQPSSTELKQFVELAKVKLIEYFNSHCDILLKKAEAMVGRKQYEEAIFQLTTVPEICLDCYNLAMDKSTEVYKLYADNKCAENITKAKGAWATFDDATALFYLSDIFPDTKCYGEAQQLVQEIKDHQCARAYGAAKGAWAAQNYIEAARQLAQVPSDSKCAKDANALSTEIRGEIRDWDNEYKKYQQEYAFRYDQWTTEDRRKDIQQSADIDYRKTEAYDLQKREIEAKRAVGIAWAENNHWGWYSFGGWLW
ncbi:MAG: hypothetical protein HOO86_08365 [Bacteroidales bacterium]|nr:hypothetical protein [Bacteroidales bacterium]